MHITMHWALATSSLLLMTGSVVAKPFEVLVPRDDKTFVGCFDSGDVFTEKKSFNYQSSGWCENYCSDKGALTFGLTSAKECHCGKELPPSSAKVSNSKCNTPCSGWPDDMCMLKRYFQIYLLIIGTDNRRRWQRLFLGLQDGCG